MDAPEQKYGWISIRERKPEYMQTCIIHCTTGFVTMAQFGGGSPGKEVFVHDQVWYIADYWMPMPLLPGNVTYKGYPNTEPMNQNNNDMSRFIECCYRDQRLIIFKCKDLFYPDYKDKYFVLEKSDGYGFFYHIIEALSKGQILDEYNIHL